MELALSIATIINALAPSIASVLLMVKKTDGTITLIPILDQADARFVDNIRQATDWLNSHPAAASKPKS